MTGVRTHWLRIVDPGGRERNSGHWWPPVRQLSGAQLMIAAVCSWENDGSYRPEYAVPVCAGNVGSRRTLSVGPRENGGSQCGYAQSQGRNWPRRAFISFAYRVRFDHFMAQI